MRICTSQEMINIDKAALTDFKIEAQLLMENAGQAACQVLLDHYPMAGVETEILVLAGKGNNAGDAFVLARQLLSLGKRVRIFHLSQAKDYVGGTLKNFEILKALKAKMAYIENLGDLESFFGSARPEVTLVDGLLGTGLKGDLEGIFFDVAEFINKQKLTQVVALDIPSGVSGDTGEVKGIAIEATLTVSFGYPKLGHFLPPGASKRGKLVNVGISLPKHYGTEGDKFLLTKAPMAKLVQERDRYGHKTSFGHTLLIGGSPGRIGAISMAAKACHKMGTGVVTVASWASNMDALVTKLPDETMSVALDFEGPDVNTYKMLLPTYSSVVVGPGLGQREDSKVLIENLLSIYQGPVVMDADALNTVADKNLSSLILNRKAPTVLTPHPGEMARLLKMDKEEILKNPQDAVKRAVDKTHAVVLLKGAATLVSSPDEVLYLNHYPNDGMATAGSGDVLAGMIGGLVGQKMGAFDSTLLAVYLHSLAGGFAAEKRGHRSMTATDIISHISTGFQSLKAYQTDVKEKPNQTHLH